MNKKALPIVVAVVVVAIILLIFSVTLSLRSATDLPMPTKPRLTDQARQHFLMRGRGAMPTGQAVPASGAASGP